MDIYLIGSWPLNGKRKESIVIAAGVYQNSSTAREITAVISSDNDHEDDEKRKKNDIDLSRKDENLKDFTNEVNGRAVLLAYMDGRSAPGHVCSTLTWNKLIAIRMLEE